MTRTHVLYEQPERWLADALDRFEKEFRYPLGDNHWFRISHGEDYTRFFRAIGDARCFVATRDREVLGVVSVTCCQLRVFGERRKAAYISDLKFTGQPGRNLVRLLQESVAWALSQTELGFSVVMDGTARSPLAYTGRFGIPQYERLGQIMILRIPAARQENGPADLKELTADELQERYDRWTGHCLTTAGGRPETRSQMVPTRLALTAGEACGVWEDTRRCKRLFRDDGAEMISGHLTSFAYNQIDDGLRMLRAVADRCVDLELPAFFVSLPREDGRVASIRLGVSGIIEAPATIFGHGIPAGAEWSVQTSEI